MADEPPLQSPSDDQADATVNDRGQRLVSVPPERRGRGRAKGSKNPPKTAEFRSLDDVVKRHAPTEVHTPADDVPPDEPDPARREKGTVGPIVLTPDAYDPESKLPPGVQEPEPEPPPDMSDGQLRTLEDLNARFDFDGSGQYYIMVNRQKPTHRNGILTHGRMRNYTQALTYEEFREYYGGGQYQLIVYGPPARGRLIDPITQKPKPKALSKPIMLIVPYEGEGASDPNPHAASEWEHDGDMSGMRQDGGQSVENRLLNRRTNNLADAKMLETSTQKELEMDARNRAERQDEVRDRRQQETTALGIVKEATTGTVEMLREELREAREQLREAQNGKSNGGGDVAAAMAQMATALGPRQAGAGEIDRLKESYEERIKNLVASHAERMKDSDERHRRELEDHERVLTREKEDTTRRADEKTRYAEEQLSSRERTLTAERERDRDDSRKERERLINDHTRDIELLKKDHERDIARQKEHYDNLLTVERNTNQRDREMLKESLGIKGDLLKANLEGELRQANNELTRLRADNARLQGEVDKKSNLPKMLDEYARTAEALGYEKPEPGGGGDASTDWKQMVLKGGVAALERLPEVIKNAGDVFAMTRGVGAGGRGAPQQQQGFAPPPRQLGPGLQPQQQHGPPPRQFPVTHVPPMGNWATEDMAPSGAPPEQFHSGLPAPQPQQPQSMPPPMAPPAMVPAPAHSMPASVPPTVNQQPAERPRPRPSAPPPQAAPPPAAPVPSEAPPAVQLSDADILQFAPMVESWIEAGDKPPEKYAEEMLSLNPGLGLVAPALTPEAVAEALRRAGRHTSPLVRRDGQRFLARFRAAILGAHP